MITQIGEFNNWRVTLDDDQILWVLIDKADASANTLDEVVFTELEQILDHTLQQPTIRGIVFGSAKPSGFVAGANIERFVQLSVPEGVLELIRRGQQLFEKIEHLSIPTVAMINGFCLGGGLEFALACRYRIAEDGPKTKLGLPEVLLGIHPGWGGSIRLPKLIGAPNAMDLILSGRTVTGWAAKKLGLVDAAVPKRQLARGARYYILEKPAPAKASFLQQLTNEAYVRPLLAKIFKAKLAKRIRAEHYPAPYAILNNWLQHGVTHAAYEGEAQSISHLPQHDTAKNLIRLFFLQERLKAQAKEIKFAPQRIHVIGAGTMGGDIAAWCVLRGMRVTLQDREAKFIAPAIKRAFNLFSKILKLPHLVREAMDRLLPDVEGRGIVGADVIIEAIYENLQAKQALFKALEQQAKADAILATNTSSIPLDEINSIMTNPARLVGIHFFNPVSKMQLVEIVQGNKTDVNVVKNATAFIRKIDRLPLGVTSSPGFLVNRALMPYLMEAMLLVEEGVPASAIDKAALDFGMPMGPIELADTVGLDVCLSVAKNLTQHYGGTVSPKLTTMVEQGQLGRKTGQGFYKYNKATLIKAPVANEVTLDQQLITDRLMLRMLNEAVACLREGVINDADFLDAGMIFGTGFAPFRGGPIHYLKNYGKANMLTTLQRLQQQYGDRFKPDVGWETL